jgi:heparan-alpha-glucosaminide N-acetyltransferase
MGITTAISQHSLQAKGTATRWSLTRKAIRRCLILFALGLWLNNPLFLLWDRSSPNTTPPVDGVEQWRIPGVLQRFAVSYLAVALTAIWCPRIEISEPDYDAPFLHRLRWILRDQATTAWEWLLPFVCILVHTVVTFHLPLPDGCPTGYLGPGGIAEQGAHAKCTGGAAGYIDRKWLGPRFMVMRR